MRTHTQSETKPAHGATAEAWSASFGRPSLASFRCDRLVLVRADESSKVSRAHRNEKLMIESVGCKLPRRQELRADRHRIPGHSLEKARLGPCNRGSDRSICPPLDSWTVLQKIAYHVANVLSPNSSTGRMRALRRLGTAHLLRSRRGVDRMANDRRVDVPSGTAVLTGVIHPRRYGESNAWHRRFSEHAIPDEDDFGRHADYVRFAWAKYGLISSIRLREFSSIGRSVMTGYYPADCNCKAPWRLVSVTPGMIAVVRE